MKTILLHVAEDAGMEGRLQVALSLARAQGAHLVCLQVTPPPYVVSDGVSPPITSDFLTQAMEEPAKRQRAALEARLANEMVQWDWHLRIGGAVRELLDQARLADVIIVSAGSGKGPLASSIAGAVAVHAPIPVLTIPVAANGFDPAGPMMIAWNGSSEAANAIRHSLPLISEAASVHIVTVEESHAGFPSADVATYLSRHGVKAEIHERRAEPSVEEALETAAREIGVVCIVMGAYGHSRIRELVFGGVTRHMLQDCPVPLLLSH